MMYTSKDIQAKVGMTKSQVDFVLLHGLIHPGVKIEGSGLAHKYSQKNMDQFYNLKFLRDCGLPYKIAGKIVAAWTNQGELFDHICNFRVTYENLLNGD